MDAMPPKVSVQREFTAPVFVSLIGLVLSLKPSQGIVQVEAQPVTQGAPINSMHHHLTILLPACLAHLPAHPPNHSLTRLPTHSLTHSALSPTQAYTTAIMSLQAGLFQANLLFKSMSRADRSLCSTIHHTSLSTIATICCRAPVQAVHLHI